MIGLRREQIHRYVPEHLRDAAIRLFGLGYEVNYRKVSPNPKKSRKSIREVIDAQNSDFMHLRLTVIWTQARGPVVVLEGSARDHRGDQLKNFEIDGMEDFWAFARSDGRCPCGKRVLSEGSARTALTEWFKRQVARGVAHREENRMYPCPKWATVYHLSRD